MKREFWIGWPDAENPEVLSEEDVIYAKRVNSGAIKVREVDEAREAMIKELVAALDQMVKYNSELHPLMPRIIECHRALARYREFEEKE